MTGLLGLASNFLPPWANPTVLALVGTGLVAGTGGAYIAHRWDAGTLAESRLETEKVRADYVAYQASTAANAARATAHALEVQIRLQDANNALQSQLQESQRLADARSKELSAILNSAKPGDTRALGPSVLAYIDRLRAGKAGNPDGGRSP
jgi:hypothetical protein